MVLSLINRALLHHLLRFNSFFQLLAQFFDLPTTLLHRFAHLLHALLCLLNTRVAFGLLFCRNLTLLPLLLHTLACFSNTLLVALHLQLLFFQFLLGFRTTLFGSLPGFGGTLLPKLPTRHFLITAFASLLYLFFALFQVFILTLYLVFAPLIQVLSFLSHHLGSLFGLLGHHLSSFFHFLGSLLGSLFGLFQQTLTFSLALTLCKSKRGSQNKGQRSEERRVGKECRSRMSSADEQEN